ncbi:MAG: XdhC family protein [Lachnospiraceae bacterium]
MKKLYQLLLDRWNQKTDTVLVTIVEGNGSVPRTTGAYMVVAKNGRIYGTIGGGNLEYQAVKKAMELAGTAAHFVEDFDLGTGENGGLGMVCGGRVKVLFYSACAQDPEVGEFFERSTGGSR